MGIENIIDGELGSEVRAKLNSTIAIANTVNRFYKVPTFHPYTAVDAWGVPFKYIDSAGVEYPNGGAIDELETDLGTLSTTVTAQGIDLVSLDSRVDFLEQNGGGGSGSLLVQYEAPLPFAYVGVDAWGVPFKYIDFEGVEYPNAEVEIAALSDVLDSHTAELASLDTRVDALEAVEGTSAITLFDTQTLHPYTAVDAWGVPFKYVDETGAEKVIDVPENSGLPVWQLATGDTQLNGVDHLAAQSKGVDFKSYYPTGSTGMHPLLLAESYFSYMFVIETILGVTRGSVYQPASEHRTTTGERIVYDGNGVPPERAISLMPIRATKDTGIDTQWSGSTPIGNFYNQTSMPAFCKRRMELRAQKFTPVSVSRTYNAGANTTTLILQLTSGASVTYGLPERIITVEGSDQPAFNGTFYTSAAGNAYTTQFTVAGDIPLPTTTLTVYNHNVKERWLASASGEGGRPVRDFVKGAIFGRRREGYADHAYSLAKKFGGFDYASTVFIIRQGETDFVNPTVTNVTATYKNTIIQMIADNNAAVKKITGQTFDPIYVCYQANGHRQYISLGNTNALMNVSQAHYELSRDGHTVFSFPSFIGSNTDGIHQTAEWSYIYSMYEARAVEDMRLYGTRRWVYPTSIVQTGSQIDVTFNVPYGNLVADNELYPLLTHWGFGTRSSNLVTDLGLITGVSMLNSTTVRITLSRPLATGEWLDYGRGHGQANHEGYNITTDTFGAYGNLHDQFTEDVYYFQQPIQGRFNRTSLTLRNYAPAFQSQCSASGTFVA